MEYILSENEMWNTPVKTMVEGRKETVAVKNSLKNKTKLQLLSETSKNVIPNKYIRPWDAEHSGGLRLRTFPVFKATDMTHGGKNQVRNDLQLFVQN